MKKIININLSGRVIPIEDSAYEKLQAYIESLRRYFSNEEGREEIINDIESRIAELMSEKVHKGATCITDADVNEIASSMGRPEDFAAEAAEETTQAKQSSQQSTFANTTARSKKRLYRDTSDKFIGGVCSGIAAYLNVDPAIVRILFAIITFGGFGLGFLAYILMWIILPPKDLEGFSGKRLYRNPDDRVIGGVAGGLAAYFDKRASTIRFIFAAPIVLSILLSLLDGFSWRHDFDFFPNIVFGSLSGTFILAYIVLWMVLPEAKSPYEKMEMRGEKVDVNSIKQNVQEGIDSMKERMKGWGEEVKTSAQNFSEKAKEFSATRGKAFASEVAQVAKPAASGLGHAIGVLFKVFFLFIAGTIAFALFVALMGVIFGGVAWWPVNNFLWTSKWQQAYAWGTLILFLGIPLIGFLIWLIRRIIGVKSKSNYLGWAFGGLWTLGWVSVVLLVASISKDIRYYEQAAPVDIPFATQPANSKLIIAVSEPPLQFTDRYWWVDSDSDGWDISEDTLKMSFIKFHILPSTDTFYHATLRKHSAGRNHNDASARARKIQYRASFVNNVLDLGSGFAIDKGSKYRGQMVEIEIRIPAGKKIWFDESVRYKLNPVNIKVQNRRWRKGGMGISIDEYDAFPWKTNTEYIMGVDGVLKNADGTPVLNYDYRYNNNDTLNEKESLEEREKRWKEEGERIKQEKRKQDDSLKRNTSKAESMDDDEERITSTSGSPVLSLVKLFD